MTKSKQFFLVMASIFILNSIALYPVNSQGNPIANWSPEWSPNGDYIVFASNMAGNADIWIMDKDGQNKRNLTAESSIDDFLPKWSSDGRYIAYLSTDGVNSTDIWVFDTTSQTAVSLTTGNQKYNYSFAWSPDGQSIAYVASSGSPVYEVVDSQIMVANVETLDTTLVLDAPNTNYEFIAWSPNSEMLAASAIVVEENVPSTIDAVIFGSGLEFTGIQLIDLETSAIRSIFPDQSILKLEWSPNSDALLIFSKVYRESGFSFTLYQIAEEQSTLLTYAASLIFGMDWFLSSDEIIYSRSTEFYRTEVGILDLTQSSFTPIAMVYGPFTPVTYSPNGQFLVYSSSEDVSDEASNIWIYNLENDETVNLTEDMQP